MIRTLIFQAKFEAWKSPENTDFWPQVRKYGGRQLHFRQQSTRVFWPSRPSSTTPPLLFYKAKIPTLCHHQRPSTTMAEIKIDKNLFQERLSHFISAWKADKRAGDALFNGASSILVLMGKTLESASFQKNNAIHVCSSGLRYACGW